MSRGQNFLESPEYRAEVPQEAPCFALRALSSTEGAFFRESVYQAAVWWERTPERPHPPPDELLKDPAFAVYVDGWGRPGDRCIVASLGQDLAGAAFYRLFTKDAPGHGFVDERIPELGLAVTLGTRRTGIGRALLSGLIVQARIDRVPALSLAVADGNYARHLYDACGFVAVARHGQSTTMLLKFDRSPAH